MQTDMDRVAALEQRLQDAEGVLKVTGRRLHSAERRLRATWALAFVGVIGGLTLGVNPEARAQFGVTLASLNNRLTAVETKTQFVSVSGTDILITGANLHIRNGLGATNGVPGDPFSNSRPSIPPVVNGLGNLIIGYNENEVGNSFGDERGGSHNLVIGVGHDYTSYAGIVAGEFNRIAGRFASVTGGHRNTAEGRFSSVTGGEGNRASESYAVISGGMNNVANNFHSWVGGGLANTASGEYASISGGNVNTAGGSRSSVSGGVNIVQNNAVGWAGGSQGGSTVTGNFRSP